VNTLRGIKIFVYSCLYELFDLSSKAESRRGRAEEVVHYGVAASSAGWMPQNKRKRQGIGAPHKSDCHRASCSVRCRGNGQGSMKAKATRVLLDAEAGGSGELLPIVKQSFQEGCYSPSIGMVMNE
jgi:hypothetical protein